MTGFTDAASLLLQIGRAVEERRRVLEVSQERLARELSIHRNTLWRIENGLVDARICISNRLYAYLSTGGISLKDGTFSFLEARPGLMVGSFAFTEDYMLREMGRAVSTRRTALGISQESLAEKAGLHRNTVGNIERGEVDLSTTSICLLYRALGVDTVTLKGAELSLS